MKNSTRLFKALFLFLAVAIIPASGSQATAQGKSKTLKVGTYDSRIVTLAYTRSVYFKEYQVQTHKDYETARQGNDTVKMKELELQALTYQHLLHQRVFGSGSASSVTDLVKDKLPALAEKKDVCMIVSKWETPYLGPSVEIIDLTYEIAQLFNPGDDFVKLSKEITMVEPEPLEVLTINADEY